jgi:hypothetical protein
MQVIKLDDPIEECLECGGTMSYKECATIIQDNLHGEFSVQVCSKCQITYTWLFRQFIYPYNETVWEYEGSNIL